MRSAHPLPFLITAAVATLSLAACKKNDVVTIVPIKDRIVLTASVEPAADHVSAFTGIVAAHVQGNLGFRVPGKIIDRLVDPGQTVTAGQPLMRIDASDYNHAIVVQAGEVAAARARWVQADADEKRYRGLVASGATSQSTYDQAKSAADSARALLSAAEAQEKVAQNQGDYSILLADADGTVVETLADPGQVVAAGQTVIRLAHAGPREASVNLPETERPALGSEARATLYGTKTVVTAHLRQLSDAADPSTRTYEARYVLDGVGATAPLGATVTLQISSPQPSVVVQVPLGAIDDEGKGAGIWVFDPKTSQVSYRSVTIATLGSEYAVLSAGVEPGLQVVAAGGHYLHEGERVQAVNDKVAMQ